MRERSRKVNQMLDVSIVESWAIMKMNVRMIKKQVGMKKHVTFAMMFCENSENENGE